MKGGPAWFRLKAAQQQQHNNSLSNSEGLVEMCFSATVFLLDSFGAEDFFHSFFETFSFFICSSGLIFALGHDTFLSCYSGTTHSLIRVSVSDFSLSPGFNVNSYHTPLMLTSCVFHTFVTTQPVTRVHPALSAHAGDCTPHHGLHLWASMV